MNINLISPAEKNNQTENGNSYTIRFKEDIVIPADSKVYLNYASLSRDSEVEFYEDQVVRVHLRGNPEDVRPSNIPSGDFVDNLLFEDDASSPSGLKDSFTITKGVYSYQLFQTKLSAGLNSILTQAGNIADLGFYRAIEIQDLQRATDEDEADFDLSFGIIKKDVVNDEFTFHTHHKKNADQNPDADGVAQCAYRKTSANVLTNEGAVRARQQRTGANPYKYDGGLRSIFLSTAGTNDKTAGIYASLTTTALSGTGTGMKVKTAIIALADGSCEAPLPLGAGQVANTLHKVDGGANDHNINTYNNVVLGGAGTSGTGAECSVVVGAGGVVGAITLTKRGIGYKAGDSCEFVGNPIGGTNDVRVVVGILTDGIEIIADDNYNINEKSGGQGYAVGDTFKINGMGGTDDTIYTIRTLCSGNQLEIFDNYAFSAKTLWTGAIDDETPMKNTSIIRCKSLKTYNEMVADGGAIICGVNSQEVASGLYGKLATTITAEDGDPRRRITGAGANTPDGLFTNPINLPPSNQTNSNKTIPNFVNLMLDFRGGQKKLRIEIANSAQRNFPEFKPNIGNNSKLVSQTCVNFPINSMSKASLNLDTTNPNSLLAGKEDEQMEFGIQFFRKRNLVANDNNVLFVRVINLNCEYDEELSIGENTKLLGSSKFIPLGFSIGITLGGQFSNGFLKCADNAKLNYLEGGVSQLEADNAGTADKTNGAKVDINITTTSGRGLGLKLNFTIAGGALDVASVVVRDCGNGYKVGDTITIPNNQGVGGTADTTLKIKQNDGSSLARPAEGSTRRNKVNSQNPFNICLSALHQDDGWLSVSAPSYTKDDTQPTTYLHTYELSGTGEIAKEINIPTESERTQGTTQDLRLLYPNSTDSSNENVLHLTDFSLDWRNESYSILIEELPLNNYKNNEFVRNGGHSKNIIANIPAPFQSGAITATNNNQRITNVFQPSFKIVSNLYNQELSTNHFKVDIRKQRNDRPATEIKNSIINFTIEPPEGFKGAMGSIAGIKKI